MRGWRRTDRRWRSFEWPAWQEFHFDSRLRHEFRYFPNEVKGFLTSGTGSATKLGKPEVGFRWSLPEVRIIAAYLLLASIWIVGSDLIMSRYVIDQAEWALAQSLKGLNFVITTALLFFLILRRAFGGWRMAEHQRQAVIEEARERFRRLSVYIQTLREDDRRRIAREIHDELGQLLTGLKMELRLIEDRLADHEERTLNPLIDKLVECSEIVDTSIRSVQRISCGLRPRLLDNLGLGPALREEAERFSSRTMIPCTIAIGNCPENLPDDVSTAAFRIFQESLTNVARHAGAHHVESSLNVADQVLELAIHDDGKGMDPSELDDPKSLGLIGMVERAGNVGGAVVFRRAPSHGTNVVLTIPLQRG